MQRIRFTPSRALAVLLSAVLVAQAPLARAAIVDTDALVAPASTVDQDRAKVREFAERANVKERLQAMGLSGLAARDRVDALSEAEVHALAQRIDGMPAGGALSNSDLVLILLVAILVAIVL